MSREAAEALLARVESSQKWPHHSETDLLSHLNTWAAIYDLDRDALKRAADWRDNRRTYRIDPLGERIADAWAAYLFNEDPRLAPADDADLDNLMALYRDGVGGTSELERAAGLCSAEGEIWPRIYVDELAAPRPLLDWVSRRQVFPLWVGPRLAGAAVWTELPWPPKARKGEVYRHFEVHVAGTVLNRLYVGKAQELGQRVELDAHPDLAGVDEWWDHDLGLLVGRIPNRLRRDRRRGVSDFRGILDYLLDLNEACTIGSSNMRLSARRRLVLSAAYANRNAAPRDDLDLTPEEAINATASRAPRAEFDPAEEVLIEDPLDTELGREGKDPIRVLEYSFDAEPLIAWKRELVESAVTRVGLMPQYVGAGAPADGSYAISGTALRLRLIPTDSVGRAKGRYWLSALPRILSLMAQLDASPAFGRPWANAEGTPTVERRPGIPVDELEEAQKHQARRAAGIESIYTGVRESHRDWTDDQVVEEVDRIREDQSQSGGGGIFGGAGF